MGGRRFPVPERADRIPVDRVRQEEKGKIRTGTGKLIETDRNSKTWVRYDTKDRIKHKGRRIFAVKRESWRFTIIRIKNQNNEVSINDIIAEFS